MTPNMIRVRVITTEDDDVFEVEPGANLLASARDRGLHIEWGCENGECGMCQVRVLRGVENLSKPTDNEVDVLTWDKLDEGVRLACQCRVLGPIEVRHPPGKT